MFNGYGLNARSFALCTAIEMHWESIFWSLSGTKKKRKKRNEDNNDRHIHTKRELYQRYKFTVSGEHYWKQLAIRELLTMSVWASINLPFASIEPAEKCFCFAFRHGREFVSLRACMHRSKQINEKPWATQYVVFMKTNNFWILHKNCKWLKSTNTKTISVPWRQK